MNNQTKVQSGTTLFDSMLGSIDYPEDSKAGRLYPFKVRCGVIKRRPPRHEFFELIIDMGRGDITRVLENKKFRGKGIVDLAFIFPERWMNVVEQQQFMRLLLRHQDVARIRCVDLLTSSPILTGEFFREQIRIVTWSDDKK